MYAAHQILTGNGATHNGQVFLPQFNIIQLISTKHAQIPICYMVLLSVKISIITNHQHANLLWYDAD